MTNKEKKAYLNQYLHLWREIEQLQDELEEWQSRAEKITPLLSGMPSGGSGGGMESSIIKISDLKAQIQLRIDWAIRTRKSIENTIQGVQDDVLRELLHFRYIQGMKWEKIAESMHRDCRWIFRLHNRALKQLTIERQY